MPVSGGRAGEPIRRMALGVITVLISSACFVVITLGLAEMFLSVADVMWVSWPRAAAAELPGRRLGAR